ncbi:MAG: hypothetical protein IKZ09_12830 [Clostridia bacterium]|nr:hypothetical protein [Clostridia bacterium]
MKFDWIVPFLVLLLVILILSAVIASCGEIVEEEKETDATETVVVTETVVETEETEPTQIDLETVIDAQLDLLTADLEALQRKIPEGFTEHDIIAAHPEAFAAITDLGADAVPYLMEIGEDYWTSYQNYRLDSGLAYARCILAYAAAQEIDGASFNHVFASPVGGYLLYQSPSVLWGMGDSGEGILYNLHLLDADGNVLAQTAGCSSLAYIDWTADGRYAVVSDRLWDERQLSTTVAFDTVRGTAVNVVARTVFDAAAAAYGQQFRYYDTRYQGYTDDGYLRIWFGMYMADDNALVGYYDYDAVTGAVMATECALFDPAADNYDMARGMDVHDVGSSFAYLMTDLFIHRLEVRIGEDWSRTLYINGALALDGFLYLNDIRAVDDYHLAVVTGGTDINSEHLYLFDRAGKLLYDTYYLTDKGMVFRGIKAVEDGRILLYGSRGYHGPTLVAPTKEQLTAGDYADYLYKDPISDTISGGELERDEFGEVPLYRDNRSDDLNPDLVFSGVYALPYLGDGKFGQIEHIETTDTLGEYLDALYNTEQ